MKEQHSSAIMLNGKNIHLELIKISDCSYEYLSWLNDSEINMFLETRWEDQTSDSIKTYVKSIIESKTNYLFKILVDNEQHIGNIKLGPINNIHNYSDISYFIGNKAYWGKGFASEAIILVCEFGFNILKLHRIQAGVYAKNIGSIRALEKAGFKKEGVFREQLRLDNGWDDHVWFGILNWNK